MNRNKLNTIKHFYKDIIDYTDGSMPSDVTQSLLECIIYDDEDTWGWLICNLIEWYKTLPSNSDFKRDLDYYIETLAFIE